MNSHPARLTQPVKRRVLALLTLLLLATSIVSIVSIAATAPATAATYTSYTSCSAFTRYAETSWYKAQQHLNAIAYTSTNQPARDLLDSDRDGYACEHLAAATAAIGEPACTGRLLWRDCSGQTMYRTVTHLTYRGDARALRGALLDVYLPYALNPAQANMASLLADAFTYPAGCQRTEMQTFIRNRVSEQQMSKAFTTVLGIGEKVADQAAKKSPAAPYAIAVEQYLKMAGKAYSAIVGVARYDAALSSVGRAATCSGSN
jgi:hypothetical protein